MKMIDSLANSQIKSYFSNIYVGIETSEMNFYSAQQKGSMWCWAASIQMLLNYYNVEISQEYIVERTFGTDYFGRLPDVPAQLADICRNLNNWQIDYRGRAYTVFSTLNWGMPTPAILVHELAHKRPVLIAYETGVNECHCVIITAASYTDHFGGPIIQSLIARDPAHSQEFGRIVYTYPYPKIINYWYIQVR